MKRTTAILLLLLFLIANSSVAVRIHWCGGMLASVNFFTDESPSCKCGEKAMKPGCCKDTTFHFKANDEFAKTSNYNVINNIISKLPNYLSPKFEILPLSHFCEDFSIYYKPPPFPPKAPIFILDKVILI